MLVSAHKVEVVAAAVAVAEVAPAEERVMVEAASEKNVTSATALATLLATARKSRTAAIDAMVLAISQRIVPTHQTSHPATIAIKLVTLHETVLRQPRPAMCVGNLVTYPETVRRTTVRILRVSLDSVTFVAKLATFHVTVQKAIKMSVNVTTVVERVTSHVIAPKLTALMVETTLCATVAMKKVIWHAIVASVLIVVSLATLPVSVSKLPKFRLIPRCSLFVSQCLQGDKSLPVGHHHTARRPSFCGYAAITRWRHFLLLWCNSLLVGCCGVGELNCVVFIGVEVVAVGGESLYQFYQKPTYTGV